MIWFGMISNACWLFYDVFEMRAFFVMMWCVGGDVWGGAGVVGGVLGMGTGPCLSLSCAKLTPSIVELCKTNTMGLIFYMIDLFCFSRVCIHIAYLSCSSPFDSSVVHWCLCYTRRVLICSDTYSCLYCLLILQRIIPVSLSGLDYMLFLVFVRLVALRLDMIHLLPKRGRSFSSPPVCRDISRRDFLFSLCPLSPELPGDRRWRQCVEITASVWRMLIIVCSCVFHE